MAPPLTDETIAWVTTSAGVAATLILSSIVALATLDAKDKTSVERFTGNAVYAFILSLLSNATALMISLSDLFVGHLHLRPWLLWSSMIGVSSTLVGLTVAGLSRLRVVAGGHAGKYFKTGIISLGSWLAFMVVVYFAVVRHGRF